MSARSGLGRRRRDDLRRSRLERPPLAPDGPCPDPGASHRREVPLSLVSSADRAPDGRRRNLPTAQAAQAKWSCGKRPARPGEPDVGQGLPRRRRRSALGGCGRERVRPAGRDHGTPRAARGLPAVLARSRGADADVHVPISAFETRIVAVDRG
jgi:hypothetical protein